MAFPQQLEVELTRPKFQFEIEGFPQVIFLLQRIDDTQVEFFMYLRQQPIFSHKYEAAQGAKLSIVFPSAVLSRVNEDLQKNGAAAGTSDKTPLIKASDAPVSEPREFTRTPENPHKDKIGPAISPNLRMISHVDLTTMLWVTKGCGDDHKLQTQRYRSILQQARYLKSTPILHDPLRLWHYYLRGSNTLVSAIAVDTNHPKYQDPQALRQKLFRHIFKMMNYNQQVEKTIQTHPETRPNRALLQRSASPDTIKLLRVAVPLETSKEINRQLRLARRYAVTHNIDFLVDRLPY